MLNSVILIGFLCDGPKKFEKEIKSEELFPLVEFKISVKKPVLSYWQKNTYEIIGIITFDFNLKKYIKILHQDHILAIKGRIINIDNQTLVFANDVQLIGKKN